MSRTPFKQTAPFGRGNRTKQSIAWLTALVVCLFSACGARASEAAAEKLPGAVWLAAGGSHAFSADSGGGVWAWGLGANGQLGNGRAEAVLLPEKVLERGAAQVAAGSRHTLFLLDDGSVLACGHNGYGQLGDGTKTDRMTAVQVMDDAVQVCAGTAFSAALKADGTVWAWGSNLFGQLGATAFPDSVLPVQARIEHVRQIAAGDSFMAVLTTGGEVFTWGFDGQHDIGDFVYWGSGAPTKLPLSDITSIACCANAAYALDEDGVLWAWGSNACGELGDGTRVNRAIPKPVALEGPVAMIFANAAESSAAALTTAGRLYVWGQLFDETPAPFDADDAVALAFGDGFALYLAEDGSVRAKGVNQSGQLGNGTAQESNVWVDTGSASIPLNEAGGSTPAPKKAPEPKHPILPTSAPAPTPTLTLAPTATPVPTVTPMPILTATPSPTATPMPMLTNAPESVPTSTAAPTDEEARALACERILANLNDDQYNATYQYLLEGNRLQKGSKCKEAKGLQQIISALGRPIDVDGIIGANTMAALHEVQTSHGLSSTDSVGVEEFYQLLQCIPDA